HRDTLARAARPALALARPAGTATRVAQLVLGTLGALLGDGQPALQRGHAALRGAHALVGLQQRLVDAAGTHRRALLHGGSRGSGRPAGRAGAVRLQAGGGDGLVERPAERALRGVGRRPDPLAVPLRAPFLRAPAGQRRVPVSRAGRLAVESVPLADLLDD